METQKKALYNALRMNWVQNPSLKVHPWQVEDLRARDSEELLERIQLLGVPMDPIHFMALAEEYDSPEELSEALFTELEPEEADGGFLAVFELWRRMLPEKPSLSLFCDELDYQIQLYDTDKLVDIEAMNSTISRLLQILNENADLGMSPDECMENLAVYSAHDIEQFLYDYLSQELEEGNLAWVHDIVEGLHPYLSKNLWFELLELKSKAEEGKINLEPEIRSLLKKSSKEPLDFHLEFLDFLTRYGDEPLFSQEVEKALSLAENEEDLYDLVTLAADFFHFLDDEDREKRVLELVKGLNQTSDKEIGSDDRIVRAFKSIVFGSD